MYVVHITAHDKKNLPGMMLVALRRRSKFGLLDGLVHTKDDVIREISYGWEMFSYWSKPGEVNGL